MELKFHEAPCRILVMTTSFITRWMLKNQISTLIIFVTIVNFWCEVCKLCREEKLITDAFGHYVKQPSP